MGSGVSGNYGGTYGSHKNSRISQECKATALNDRVSSWAQRTANKLAEQSKRQRDKFNTACVVIDSETGKRYYGRNNGIKDGDVRNPVLFGDENHKGLLPSKSLNQYKVGNCAEVNAVNNVLNHGAKLENLYMTTIHTTKTSFGQLKPACKNCTYTFKGKVSENYAGWGEED